MTRLREENEREERELAATVDAAQQQEEQKSAGPQETIIEVDAKELEGMDEQEQMMALLGFGADGFGSTKGQKVKDNHEGLARGAAAKHKARKYRQYMNRKNGFNRPLDKMD